MPTRLTKTIKREVLIGTEPHTVTISEHGLKIVPKGKRNGREVTWDDLITGTVELDNQLVRSLRAAEPAKPTRNRRTRQ